MSENTIEDQNNSKTNHPCYYYNTSGCNKGDSCDFLHIKADIKVIKCEGKY